MKRLLLSCVAAVNFALVGAAAHAYEIQAFGHKVEVVETDDDNVLKIDGKEMHQDRFIFLDQYAVVDGTDLIVGLSSSGGNACESSPFVVSFPHGAAPRFDGPLNNCFLVNSRIGKSDITFEVQPVAGETGQRWRWTRDKGIQPAGVVEHVVSSFSGWNALRSRKVQHLADLLDYQDFSDALKERIGADWTAIRAMITGPGLVRYSEGLVIADVCQPHACDEQSLLVVADQSRRVSYIAWKLKDKKIAVSPIVSRWPGKARVALRNWAKIWVSQ